MATATKQEAKGLTLIEAIRQGIYEEMKRGYGSGMWGWKTAYSDSPTG